MITIRNMLEMKEYYVKEVNTYEFNDDVEFLCNVDVRADISARDIKGGNINVHNISARDINAYNIKVDNIRARNIFARNIRANDISYYAVCFAYKNIECNSIEAINSNSKHFVLNGKLVVKGRNKI